MGVEERFVLMSGEHDGGGRAYGFRGGVEERFGAGGEGGGRVMG